MQYTLPKTRSLSNEEISAATPNELTEMFMPFAIGMAHRLCNGQASEDDIQNALEGLHKAALKYDSQSGSFVGYAKYWIFQSIRRGHHRDTRHISMPEERRNELLRIQVARERMISNQIPVTLENLIAETGLSEKQIKRLLQAASPEVTYETGEVDDWIETIDSNSRPDHPAEEEGIKRAERDELRKKILNMAGNDVQLAVRITAWLDRGDEDAVEMGDIVELLRNKR